ncbi:hypothetical protein COI_1957 [Mannheimia haemolytica serotype A2 str. OVINE]|nr:hypothetical protein COI_1957 [Mannheimia haemolytica serotype A2 str. OVINE]
MTLVVFLTKKFALFYLNLQPKYRVVLAFGKVTFSNRDVI